MSIYSSESVLLKVLWSEFYNLINKFIKPDCDSEEFEERAKLLDCLHHFTKQKM